MRVIKLLIVCVGILPTVSMLLCLGCQNARVTDPDQSAIMAGAVDMFTRIKLRDKSAIYENEFPYLREDTDLEDFLNNTFIKGYFADTLEAMQIDSIIVQDTMISGKKIALAFVQMEYRLADSSLFVNKIRLLYFNIDNTWLKPTLSRVARQNEFEEEIRVYWEAVREKQRADSVANAQSGSSQ